MSEPGTQAQQGANLMVTYKEVLETARKMDRIEAMLKGALALKGELDDHEIRIVALEQIQAQVIAVRNVWRSIGMFLGGVATAIGGGAVAFILPKLWGG